MFGFLSAAESRTNIWRQFNAYQSAVASDAARSKALVLLLLIHCLLLMSVLCLVRVLLCST